jgi:hypothetical protein
LEDLGIDGRIITKYIFENWNTDVYNGLIWLRMNLITNLWVPENGGAS